MSLITFITDKYKCNYMLYYIIYIHIYDVKQMACMYTYKVKLQKCNRRFLIILNRLTSLLYLNGKYKNILKSEFERGQTFIKSDFLTHLRPQEPVSLTHHVIVTLISSQVRHMSFNEWGKVETGTVSLYSYKFVQVRRSHNSNELLSLV